MFKSYHIGIGLAVLQLCLSRLSAAPLAWFPGPAMDYPGSEAVTVVMPGLGNVVIAGTTAYPEGLVATNIYWTPLEQPFYGNIAPGAVASGGAIIVYGGNDGVSSVSTVVNYSPSDGSSTMASMSVPRSCLGYAPDHSGNAYAIGGLDDGGNPLASAERLNPHSGAAGVWSPIASLPAARFDFPAVFDRTNYIYIFGGYTDAVSGVEVSSVLRYSVSKNTWTNLSAMPVATAGSAAALGPDGNIYVVGGLSGGVPTDTVQVYNPASDSWTLSTPLPEPLSGSALGADSLGRLVVMGGVDSYGYDTGDVWRSQQLNVPDSPPVFTQFPAATNAVYLNPYLSSITATGSPPPTYSLVSGPAGMQVDNYSGAITWTPQGLDQIGAIPVTVQAANFVGSTNWTFTINVPNPPPTAVTNLTVVGVTESSVTLSWSPEDPVAGPVTYSVWLKHVLHSPKGSLATVTYSQIGSSTTNTTLTISGLAAGLSQGYYVLATGPGGVSGYAGIGAATLPAPPPANLRVTGLTSTTITLAWDAPTGGFPVVSYEVLGWYNGYAAQYPLAVPNINGTSVAITGLAPGTAMLWGVSARDTAGNVSAYDYLPSLVINPVPVPPQISVVPPNASASLVNNAVVSTPASGGGFQISVSEGGSTLQTVLIQATTNPADPGSWEQIGSVLPTSNPFIFTDTNAPQNPMRFYRAAAP